MRDGSGIYTYPPGTPGVAGQTIFSARYNTFLDDLATTLNTKLPINMGGTNATDAAAARTSLQAETAMQVVTNYDTQVWETGSFKSTAGATNAPEATAAYVGTVQVQDTNNIVVQARNLTTGTMYMRKKVGGTWSGWSVDSGIGLYVAKTGDTMTGSLQVPLKGSLFGLSGGTAAGAAVTQADANILLYNNSSTNWAGVGVDAVGDMWIRTGTSGTPVPRMAISNTGTVSLTGALFTPGAITANGGFISSGPINTTSKGSQFGLNGGNNAFSGVTLTDTNIVVYQTSGSNWCGVGADPAGNFWIRTGTSGTPIPAVRVNTDQNVHLNGAGVNLASPIGTGANLHIMFPSGYYGIVTRQQTDPGVAMGFFNAAAGAVGNITTTATTTGFNAASDGRLKEDLKSFDAGQIIDNTNVYDFAWKSTGERSYGIIAQEANEVYPSAVTHNEENDWWGIDYSKYIPVLLQELKALRARVAVLEGRLLTGTQPA